MLGASWVDGHSIAALAAQHNQLLNALLLAAERNKVGLLFGMQQLRPCAVVALRQALPLQKSPPALGPSGRSGPGVNYVGPPRKLKRASAILMR